MANGYLHHQGTKFYPAPFFPIGSIYLTVGDYNPGTYFGGTWVKLTGGFLYASVNTAGGSGNGTGTNTGAATGNTGSTALNTDQIPSHSHYGLFDQTNAERFQSWGTGTNHTALINGMGTNQWNGQFHVGLTGGGQGHTHTLNNHTHVIPYIGVWVWKRTA